jgi:hypothetical protein
MIRTRAETCAEVQSPAINPAWVQTEGRETAHRRSRIEGEESFERIAEIEVSQDGHMVVLDNGSRFDVSGS